MYIYLNLVDFMLSVGKYTSPMDSMLWVVCFQPWRELSLLILLPQVELVREASPLELKAGEMWMLWRHFVARLGRVKSRHKIEWTNVCKLIYYIWIYNEHSMWMHMTNMFEHMNPWMNLYKPLNWLFFSLGSRITCFRPLIEDLCHHSPRKAWISPPWSPRSRRCHWRSAFHPLGLTASRWCLNSVQ